MTKQFVEALGPLKRGHAAEELQYGGRKKHVVEVDGDANHEDCQNINPLNAELNPICHLVALLGVHHFLHVSRIRVKSLTFRLLMSHIYIYIYIHGAPILDVSGSHTTTHHSR